MLWLYGAWRDVLYQQITMPKQGQFWPIETDHQEYNTRSDCCRRHMYHLHRHIPVSFYSFVIHIFQPLSRDGCRDVSSRPYKLIKLKSASSL